MDGAHKSIDVSFVHVRLAEPADYDAIANLIVETYIGEGFSTPAQRAWLASVHRTADATVLVAGDGKQLLGCVTVVSPPSPLVQIAADNEAEIRLLVVTPQARSRGVGKALTLEAIERARQAGRSAIVLSTQTAMLSAQRLYARLGFERTPAKDWLRDERQFLAYRLPLSVPKSS